MGESPQQGEGTDIGGCGEKLSLNEAHAGWEAGDRHELSNLPPRQPGGQVGKGLRDPGLIHEMMGLCLSL